MPSRAGSSSPAIAITPANPWSRAIAAAGPCGGAFLPAGRVHRGEQMVSSREHSVFGAQARHRVDDERVPCGLRVGEQPREGEIGAAGGIAEQRSRGPDLLACARRNPTCVCEDTRSCGHGGREVVALVPAVELERHPRVRLDVRDERRPDRNPFVQRRRLGHWSTGGSRGCQFGSRFSANARGPSS